MISHALLIVRNELESFLEGYGGTGPFVELGSIAELNANGSANGSRNKLLLTVVNLQEERTLKNVLVEHRDDVAMKVRYEEPALHLNAAVLVTATHTSYAEALLALSRAMVFFQAHPVLTPDSVAPTSLDKDAPLNERDRLTTFKLVLNLWSPTLEESNHLWGTLGGRQYPFALYSMRMFELRLGAVTSEGPLIETVLPAVVHFDPAKA